MKHCIRRIALTTLLFPLAAAAVPLGAAESERIAAPPKPRIEVAFVLDTTGSMSGLIDGAKRKIWQIANQLADGKPAPEIRMALVAYRDRGDAYVTQVTDLTRDLDAIYAALQGFVADGGGDGPESVNQALHEARTKLSWSRDANVYRAIFLVGDAPPHMDYAEDVAYGATIRNARAQGIVVNTIQCGAYADATPVWREIAELGAGRYVAIAQDGGVQVVAAPQDAELGELSRAVAETVIAWGDGAEQAELNQKRERALAAPAPEAASRLAYLSKTGGRANDGREDLVDAVKEGRVELDKLKKDQLPASLRELTPAAREKAVGAAQAQREALQQRIATLTKQRDAYLLAEEQRLAAAGKGDGFDQQVLEAIRAQAASKGIAY